MSKKASIDFRSTKGCGPLNIPPFLNCFFRNFFFWIVIFYVAIWSSFIRLWLWTGLQSPIAKKCFKHFSDQSVRLWPWLFNIHVSGDKEYITTQNSCFSGKWKFLKHDRFFVYILWFFCNTLWMSRKKKPTLRLEM